MSQDGQRDPKGRPKGAQVHPKEHQRSLKDGQREPRAPKGAKMSPKLAQGAPKALQRDAKEAKRSPKDKYISKNSRSTAQADVMQLELEAGGQGLGARPKG